MEHDLLEQESELEANKEKESILKSNLESLPEELNKTLDILNEKERIDKELKNYVDLIDEYQTPQEKRNFIENNLNEINKNEELAEVLEILEEKDILMKDIAKEKEIFEKEKELLEKEKNNEQNEQNLDLDDRIGQKVNEDYQKRLEEMEKDHSERIKEMEDRLSKLEDNFQDSVNNLLNSDSLQSLLKSLYEMDKSLSLLLKERENNFDELNRQREEKLELALQSNTTKEVVIDFVKELHEKTKAVNGGLNEMQKEKNFYVELDQMVKNVKKNPNDIKTLEKMENFIKIIDKETPGFKENYPKKYKESNKIIENTRKNILDKSKVDTKTRTI